MQYPTGYWEFDADMSYAELARIKDSLSKSLQTGAMVAVPSSVRFVHLGSGAPNAFCRYCASPNLTCSMWCTQCGAQMMDGDK